MPEFKKNALKLSFALLKAFTLLSQVVQNNTEVNEIHPNIGPFRCLNIA